MISHSRLLEVLHYDPVAGTFVWKTKHTCSVVVGSYAGFYKHKNKTVCIEIFGKYYNAASIAWFYVTGEWPKGRVARKDLNWKNIKFDNLITATVSQRAANCPMRSHNQSGFKGVRIVPSGNYQAFISHKGKSKYLGTYRTPQEANAAYLEAAKELYGQFARAK